ncbi:MAG: heavy-metal-associated domain-containing protein [Rikenellaceae bacterium]
MNKFILTIITSVMCIAFTTNGYSKSKKENKIITTEFSTNINCSGCVSKVMNFMPYQKGVKEVKADLETKTITISYSEKKTNEEKIVKALKKIDIAAESKKDCCK